MFFIAIGAGYFQNKIFSSEIPVQYITALVERGTLISAISGSGQVSVSDQVDIKPQVSGKVVRLYVAQGQEIKAGALLVQIDSSDAQRAVRDAETSLETANLELEELLQPTDSYSLLQAENLLLQARDSLTKLKFTQESNYQKAQDTKQKAEDNIIKAYEDGFNTVANAFLDLPSLMSGLEAILYKNTINRSQNNISAYYDMVKEYDSRVFIFKDDAAKAYQDARERYNQNFFNYKNTSRYSDQAEIDALINETLDTVRAVAESIKSTNNLLDLTEDLLTQRDMSINPLIKTYQSDLGTYTAKTNSPLSSLLSIQRTIKDSHETIANAKQDLIEMEQNNPLDLAAQKRSIKEKEENLAKLKADPDDLDVRAKKITIQQREDALLAAKQNLADYFIRTPFDSIVAELNSRRGDSVSPGTTLLTVITKQKIAEVTLNEIDVVKVERGQLATLTFDALEDITLTGKVVEIDTLGAVNQGVVTYNVKIAFDTQDERIKPGMTIDASIITDRKDGIVLVPNAAVKTQRGQIYVEVMQNGTPQAVPVEVGLSNELFTEITGGLEVEAEIVTARIGGERSTQTANVEQSFRGLPSFGGGGGGFRGGGGFNH